MKLNELRQLIREEISKAVNPLSPQNKKEKLLSSPIRSKDTQGNQYRINRTRR
jgi:hypothetical protein